MSVPLSLDGLGASSLEGALLAVCVGNTRVRLGLFTKQELAQSLSVAHSDVGAVASEVQRLCADHHDVPIVMASVHEGVASALEGRIGDLGEVYRIGRDVAVPLRHALDDASTLGQDRQLCALAAYTRAQQACVVIDAGTAITVDFVDGEGTFQGGVIAPGVAMMLAGLHEKTSALPSVAWMAGGARGAGKGPFGKDTRQAMLLGVRGAAIGLARYMVEQYAEAYEAYPQIIATGGDAAALFEGDEIVEHLVPDLQLIGVLEACKAALDGRDDAAEGEE